MEQHLIHLQMYRRVKPEPDDIVRVRLAVRDHRTPAYVLGRKGSMHLVATENTYTHDQLLAAAREGLLYLQQEAAWAFAPAKDAENGGLPVLMEAYHEAFRKRQLDNRPVPEQGKLNLKPAQAQ